MKKINKQLLVFTFILTFLHSSCKKFLEIDAPRDAATQNEMFSNDAIATSAITGIYSKMAGIGGFSGNQNSITILAGLSADELRSHNSSLDFYYKNDIQSSDFVITSYLWGESYANIYTSNAILEGLQVSIGVSDATKRQLRGEAKFVRAFSYFYLVNLFGEVPLHLSTDYRINEIANKSTKELVFNQITADLLEAENLLSQDYIASERIRPNRWAATALLSRVYLYNKQWTLAERKATEVIDQKATYELTENLDNAFLKNSKEAVWQLMPTAGNNTKEGASFILAATPSFVSLSADFASSFEPNDNRKAKWVKEYTNVTGKYYFPFKYKIRTTVNAVINEYSMVIRLAELHLIRAEARAQLALSELSTQDINLIRKRAGLASLTGLNSDQCLLEVEKQRRFELFTEWGHRWLDLKRTGNAARVLAPIKGASWQNTDVLYPIPLDEITRNPNVSQNPGY